MNAIHYIINPVNILNKYLEAEWEYFKVCNYKNYKALLNQYFESLKSSWLLLRCERPSVFSLSTPWILTWMTIALTLADSLSRYWEDSYCYKHPLLWALRHYRHFSLFSSTSMKTEVSGMMQNTTLTCTITIIIAWTAGKVSTGSRAQVKQTHSVGFHFFLCFSFSSFHKCTLLHNCQLNSVKKIWDFRFESKRICICTIFFRLHRKTMLPCAYKILHR